MFSLLLLASLQLPESTELTARHLLRRSQVDSEEKTAAARVGLWIDPKGKVRECDLILHAGNQTSAEQICRGMVGARFEAARGPEGEEIHSYHRIELAAYPQDDQVRARQMNNMMKDEFAPADLVLTITSKPEFARKVLTILVDKSGKVISCEARDGISDDWVRASCEQASGVEFEQRLSREGEPVPYVRSLIVEFQEQ